MTMLPEPPNRHRRFLRGEEGAVSVEFVIVLPALILILLIFTSSALHFAVAADVQQLAHELARAALPYAGSVNWCSTVVQTWAEAVAGTFPMLTPSRLATVECALDAGTGIATIEVTYNTAGTPASVLGRFVGLDVATIHRRGLVQI